MMAFDILFGPDTDKRLKWTFRMYDKNNDGKISFYEFVLGLSTLTGTGNNLFKYYNIFTSNNIFTF